MVARVSLLFLTAVCAKAETQADSADDWSDETCFMQERQHLKESRSFMSSGRLAGTTHMAMDEVNALTSGDVSDMDSIAESSVSYTVRLHKHIHKEPVVLLQGGGKVTQVHKISYFGETCVGTQCFTVVYDTGSGNLIVPGSDCSSRACTDHKKYKMLETGTKVDCGGQNDASKRNVDSQGGITINFGAGQVKGHCIRDKLCLGTGACVEGNFISAHEMSTIPFALFSFEGVQGLGLPDLSQEKSFNLMQNFLPKLKQPVFSVFLSDSDEEESQVTFGSHLPENMHGSELLWQPVTRRTGYWEVQIKDITINNRPKDLCKDCHVAVDTGTSNLAGPSKVIQLMQNTLGVKSDCSNYDDLPLLGFQMQDNKVMNLEPRDYVNKKDGECKDTFMALDLPPPTGPMFVFGIPFLQKFYTVYDQEERRVGFAVAKHGHVTDADAKKIITNVAEM